MEEAASAAAAAAAAPKQQKKQAGQGQQQPEERYGVYRLGVCVGVVRSLWFWVGGQWSNQPNPTPCLDTRTI